MFGENIKIQNTNLQLWRIQVLLFKTPKRFYNSGVATLQ